MMLSARVVFFVVALFVASCSGQTYVQPEQVHLSYGGNYSTMYVTWITFDSVYDSIVEYGVGSLSQSVNGTQTMFTDGGSQKRKIYVHRAALTGLKEKTAYIYHVGSDYGWSAVYFFNTFPSGNNWQPRFAVYGDMGNVNAQSLGRLQVEAIQKKFDAILHVGDMAYNLDTNNAQYGDQFFRQIEPIAAYVPYMVTVGNHENAYNFSNYVNRFTMPGGEANLFYSYDLGPVHFIGYSTEFYFYVEYGWLQIANQFAWLEQDLKKAQANRDNIPWVIAMGHRPMYCSNYDSDDCTKFESIVRTGLPLAHVYGLEDLFDKYGVDMIIQAHEHSYERLWPVYNRTTYNGSAEPYTDPCAAVHIITGAAGCQEKTDPFIPHPHPWSAYRSSDYGFGRMQVFNATHLYFEEVSDDQKGAVIDKMWLIKNSHGPYDRSKCTAGEYLGLDIAPPAWHKEKCKNCSKL